MTRTTSVGRWALIGVVVFIIAVSLSTPVTAAVTINGNTTYQGYDGESQAIEVTTTISPEGSEVTDMIVTVAPTENTFLDRESFSTTINPGSADVNITYQGNGQFRIGELGSSERIRLQFDVYPRTIKQESLRAATVRVEYVQNGQTLSDERAFESDLTQSSHFVLQQAQQESQRSNMWARIGQILTGVFVLSVIGGGVWWFVLREDDTEDLGI